MHYRLCDWLKICECHSLDCVLTHDAISFSCNIFMHSHVLFFFSFSVPKHLFCCVFFFLLSSLISLIWHLGSLFLRRTRYLIMVFHLLLLFLLFPFETSSMIQNPKSILMKTSVTGVDTRGESPPSFCNGLRTTYIMPFSRKDHWSYYQIMGLEFRYALGKVLSTQDCLIVRLASHHYVFYLNPIKN